MKRAKQRPRARILPPREAVKVRAARRALAYRRRVAAQEAAVRQRILADLNAVIDANTDISLRGLAAEVPEDEIDDFVASERYLRRRHDDGQTLS